MDIASEFLRYAADESSSSAINILQDFQGSLEQICEVGNEEERKAAAMLLRKVNDTIIEINNVVSQ